MNFKKTWKRFWTLSRSSEGFTLVELIVVIAILAILAGIAVPAYSGYIKKANKAADLQLLGAVNTAFGASALENNKDVKTVTGASMPLNADGTVKIASVTPYAEAFARYYAGNENSAFKTITLLSFNPIDGVFEPASDAISGLSGKFTSEQIAALAGSTFITADGLGVNGLLAKVDEVTDFAALMGGPTMNEIFNSPAFLQTAASVLGLKMDDPNLATALNSELDRLGNELMAADSSITDLEEAKMQVKANAAVLMAAQYASQQDTASIKTLLTGTDVKGAIVDNLRADAGTGMSQAALAYGMYTAYAYSTGDATLIENTKNPLTILDNLQDPGFQNYLNNADGGNDQAAADLNGYMSAMGMVNTSTSDKDAVSEVLVNGFNDPALAALLQQSVAGVQ